MWIRFRRKSYIILCLSCFVLFGFYRSIQSVYDVAEGEFAGSQGRNKYRPRDMHVVIGFYHGNDLPWVKGENLTDEILNTNMYDPDPLAGKDGEAVLIPTFEAPKVSKLFQINRFNIMASDRIPVNRTLKDVRRKDCKMKKYPGKLPTTSIIIVFHNEAWSTLMRTVWSVVNRSPKELVADIVLVDDASQRAFLRPPHLTPESFASLPATVKIIRSPNRIGLIKARLLGAKSASGQVLTFLDAHCECTEGWLEPLLCRIKDDRKIIASPVIDIINDDTFQYIQSFELHQGGFNWELHFRWFSLPSDIIDKRREDGDTTKAFKTPVMAGGLFSIDKEFFYELGSYDDKMEVWGGENLEISFRGWLCGATLEIVPCSHVGHLFRKSSPYSFPSGVGTTLHSNLARVALVWLDEWKDFYFRLHPEVAVYAGNQSIEERLALKKRLGCKPFRWFLENVWPHHFLPMDDRFMGRLRNGKSGKCLQSPQTKSFGQPYGPPTISHCILELYTPQLFVITPEGYIKTDNNVCLDAVDFKDGSEVRIMACNTLKRQKWVVDKRKGNVQHVMSKKCLDLSDRPGEVKTVLRGCLEGSRSQQWGLEKIDWRKSYLEKG